MYGVRLLPRMIASYNSGNPSVRLDDKKWGSKPIILDPEHNAWGFALWDAGLTFLVFEKADKQVEWISLQKNIDVHEVLFYYNPK
jgi:hypothetical protein